MINVSTGLLTQSEITIAWGEDQMTVLDSGLGFAGLPDEMGVDRLAQFAYYAYGSQTEWKNYQGLPMPKWGDLPPHIRGAWRNSVSAVLAGSGTVDGIISTSTVKPLLRASDEFLPFEPVVDLKD